MADIEIVASHLKSQRGRGQNQDQTGVTTNKPLPIIPNVAPPNASADAGDWQTRDVGKSKIKAHDAMPPRAVDSGSPGGAVPSKTNHTAKR